MSVLTSSLPGDAASGRNIEAGVTQQVLVVGLESVEVVVVFSLASLPPEADLFVACFMFQSPLFINNILTLTSSTSGGMTGRWVSMFLSKR